MARLFSVQEVVHPPAVAAATNVRPLLALTDEELLAVLGDDPVAALVRAPFVGELPDEERNLAMRSGLRSLVARGIVDAPIMSDTAPNTLQVEPEADQPVLDTSEDLSHILTFYRTAERFAIIDLPVPDDRRRQFSVVLPSSTVTGHALVEEVTHGGLHGFSVLPREDLPAALWQAGLEPEGSPLADGTAAVEIAVVTKGVEDPLVLLIGSGPNAGWQVRMRETLEGAETVVEGNDAFVHAVLGAVLAPEGSIADVVRQQPPVG